MRKFNYYENGKKETLTESQLYKQFSTDEDLEEQKEQGTTFADWVNEGLHMQILNEIK